MKYHLDMLDTQAEFVVNNTPVQETNDAQTARVHNNVSVHETNDLEMAMDVPMNMDGYNDHENDEEDNMQDNYTDDYFDKRKAVSFIMNLKEMYRIRETAAEDVASGVNNIVESYMHILRTRLRHFMQDLDTDISERTFGEIFDIELPFSGVVSAHERKKFIKENYLYIANFEEHLFIERNLDRYDEQCYELSVAQTQSVRDAISRAYGINGRSVARDFPNVDLTQQIPHDIMHVIFEGVAVYEIKLVLKVLLDDRLFSVTELNDLIEFFSYGYAIEVVNQLLFQPKSSIDMIQLSSSLLQV
uniref:Uncharacterized protein n=1 Tax=Magallana gigas TaxID=29159 RepID=A0A8W8MHE2_MAGGI